MVSKGWNKKTPSIILVRLVVQWENEAAFTINLVNASDLQNCGSGKPYNQIVEMKITIYQECSALFTDSIARMFPKPFKSRAEKGYTHNPIV